MQNKQPQAEVTAMVQNVNIPEVISNPSELTIIRFLNNCLNHGATPEVDKELDRFNWNEYMEAIDLPGFEAWYSAFYTQWQWNNLLRDPSENIIPEDHQIQVTFLDDGNECEVAPREDVTHLILLVNELSEGATINLEGANLKNVQIISLMSDNHQPIAINVWDQGSNQIIHNQQVTLYNL